MKIQEGGTTKQHLLTHIPLKGHTLENEEPNSFTHLKQYVLKHAPPQRQPSDSVEAKSGGCMMLNIYI